MATRPADPPPDAAAHARRWREDYLADAPPGDVMAAGPAGPWLAMLEELAAVASDDLGHARERVQRHAADIGTGFRVAGEADERPWPLSPLPLLIDAAEWRAIEAGAAE